MDTHFLIKRHSQATRVQGLYHMIFLHGFGANEDDLLGLADFFPTVSEFSSIRAPIELGPGSYAWYSLLRRPDGTLDADPNEVMRSQSLAAEAIEQARANSQVSHLQTMILGFSQGAIMSLTYGLTHPDAAAGIIALSGRLPHFLVPPLEPCNSQTRYFLGHGTHDNVLPDSGSEAAARAMKEAGYQVEFHRYPIPHTIGPEELTDINHWINSLAEG